MFPIARNSLARLWFLGAESLDYYELPVQNRMKRCLFVLDCFHFTTFEIYKFDDLKLSFPSKMNFKSKTFRMNNCTGFVGMLNRLAISFNGTNTNLDL